MSDQPQDPEAVDELYDDAVVVTLAHGKGSAQVLQRQLRIGYGRASGLLDKMADAGLLTQGWANPPYAVVAESMPQKGGE